MISELLARFVVWGFPRKAQHTITLYVLGRLSADVRLRSREVTTLTVEEILGAIKRAESS